MKITINFLDELKTIVLPANFQQFKNIISEKYDISMQDIEELIVSYQIEAKEKKIILDEIDYQQAIFYAKQSTIHNNKPFTIILAVSEASRLYNKPIVKRQDISTKETLEEEIQERKRQLKLVLESERLVNTKNSKISNLDRKIKSAYLLAEYIRKASIKMKRRAFDQIKLKSVNYQSFIIATKFDITDSITIDNLNFEETYYKITETDLNNDFIDNFELIDIKNDFKADNIVNDTDRIINRIRTSRETNKTMHIGIDCNGCGITPIIGFRYKCTVCNNFNYCNNCEDKLADNHDHPFIKLREHNTGQHLNSSSNYKIIIKNTKNN